MNFEFPESILIVEFNFDQTIKTKKIMNLFSLNQSFIQIRAINVFDDESKKKSVQYCVDKIWINRNLKTDQTNEEYFKEVLSLIKRPLHAVIYIRPSFEKGPEVLIKAVYNQLDKDMYQLAYEKQAHLIHFDGSNSYSAESVLKNHALLDGPISTVL